MGSTDYLTIKLCRIDLAVLNPVVLTCADICLKEVPSIAESVYNIQLLKEFSNEYLSECFHLKPEDLLYSPPVLKVIQETLRITVTSLFKAALHSNNHHVVPNVKVE